MRRVAFILGYYYVHVIKIVLSTMKEESWFINYLSIYYLFNYHFQIY